MRTIRYLSLMVLLGARLSSYGAKELTSDPAKDYLSKFSFYDGRTTIYSDDRLLRMDLDLNNDGRKEVLLSMARDRNGKAGNVWVVYSETQNGYVEVGGMTFDASHFYLGQIDELRQYGLVSFWPGGAGEGTLIAHLFDGSAIRQVQVAAVSRDQQTRELAGTAIRNKYIREKAISEDDIATLIDAATMSEKYGVKVEATTYRQAVEGMLVAQKKSAEQGATPRPLSSSSPSTSPSYSVASQSASAASPAASASSANVSERVPRSMLFWIGGIGVVAVIGVLIWKMRS